MGLDIGGYEQTPDWPKMGPSFLIAASLILVVRTAKWKAESDQRLNTSALDTEIAYSVFLVGRLFASLVAHHPIIFPSTKRPTYQPNDDEVPK